jgi:hypothetical protein
MPTLGERLDLPNTVRIVFEVTDLAHATPASISRCGMIYMDASVVTHAVVYRHGILTQVT